MRNVAVLGCNNLTAQISSATDLAG